MKKSKKPIFILSILGLLITACNDDNDIDTNPPQIEVESPHDGQHVHPGEIIHFDAEFSDNVGLGQFKIDIHYGGDHSHKGAFADEPKWSWEHIGDLSGRNRHVHLDIEVPDSIHDGKYHMLVYCTDQAGNESWTALTIYIEDDDH